MLEGLDKGSACGVIETDGCRWNLCLKRQRNATFYMSELEGPFL